MISLAVDAIIGRCIMEGDFLLLRVVAESSLAVFRDRCFPVEKGPRPMTSLQNN
jgi:hypothetical protein